MPRRTERIVDKREISSAYGLDMHHIITMNVSVYIKDLTSGKRFLSPNQLLFLFLLKQGTGCRLLTKCTVAVFQTYKRHTLFHLLSPYALGGIPKAIFAVGPNN
jgi:hypothetical protein